MRSLSPLICYKTNIGPFEHCQALAGEYCTFPSLLELNTYLNCSGNYTTRVYMYIQKNLF